MVRRRIFLRGQASWGMKWIGCAVAVVFLLVACSDDDTCKNMTCNPNGKTLMRCELCVSAGSADPVCSIEIDSDGEPFRCEYDPDKPEEKKACEADALAWQNDYCS